MYHMRKKSRVRDSGTAEKRLKLEKLPADVLCEIFSFLRFRCTVSMKRISKFFACICQLAVLRLTTLELEEKRQIPYLKLMKFLQHVEIYTEIPDDILHLMLKTNKNLKSINGEDIPSNTRDIILSQSHHVEALVIGPLEFNIDEELNQDTFIKFLRRQGSNLRELTLDYYIGNDVFTAISQNCTKLIKCCISFFDNLYHTQGSAEPSIGSVRTFATNLSLLRWLVWDSDCAPLLPHLRALKNLKSLTTYGRTPDFLKTIAESAPQIEHLDIADERCFISNEMSFLHVAAHCENLKSINVDLDCIPYAGDFHGLRTVLGTCPIERLCVNGADLSFFECFDEELGNIKGVYLMLDEGPQRPCTPGRKFTSSFLELILEKFPSLEEFSLHQYYSVDRACVNALADSQLRRIYIREECFPRLERSLIFEKKLTQEFHSKWCKFQFGFYFDIYDMAVRLC